MISLFFSLSVVKHHIEGATDSNNNFLAAAMGMSATTASAWDIVSPIDTRDIERYLSHLLDYRQVAARIYYLR